ncbi:hypothetical protein JCM17961_28230 [Endothiovibrio diazotrophicus]
MAAHRLGRPQRQRPEWRGARRRGGRAVSLADVQSEPDSDARFDAQPDPDHDHDPDPDPGTDVHADVHADVRSRLLSGGDADPHGKPYTGAHGDAPGRFIPGIGTGVGTRFGAGTFADCRRGERRR